MRSTSCVRDVCVRARACLVYVACVRARLVHVARVCLSRVCVCVRVCARGTSGRGGSRCICRAYVRAFVCVCVSVHVYVRV